MAGKAGCGLGGFIPSSLAGLGGGSASGKTTVATMIIEALDVPWVVLLSMDSFYKVRLRIVLARLRGPLRPLANPHRGETQRGFSDGLVVALQMVLRVGGEVAGHSGGDGHVHSPLLRGQVLTKPQQEQAANNDFNFDHPDAFDFDLIIATLKKLKQGKSVKIPIYDFTTHSRKKEWVRGAEGMG